jgi:uncharacterized membrane protein
MKIALMNNFGKVDLIKEAWALFKKNLNIILALMGVYLVYYIAQYGVNYLFKESFLATILSLVFLIVFLVIQLGAYNLVLKIVDGHKATIQDLYTYPNIAMKILRNIVAGIIVGVLVFGGLILFIVPGIYLGIRLMFFTYYIVDKDAGIMDSIKMSWNLTKNGVINLFFLSILFLLINFIGALFFGIGLAVTIPLTFLATALLYRKFQK